MYAAGPDEYTTFEGYKTPEETKIGCSYAKLCQSVKPGNRLLFADGSVVIKVLEIIDDRHLRGEVLNDKKLGERKNGNLPGVKVELDVLQPKDVDDIKNFAQEQDGLHCRVLRADRRGRSAGAQHPRRERWRGHPDHLED